MDVAVNTEYQAQYKGPPAIYSEFLQRKTIAHQVALGKGRTTPPVRSNRTSIRGKFFGVGSQAVRDHYALQRSSIGFGSFHDTSAEPAPPELGYNAPGMGYGDTHNNHYTYKYGNDLENFNAKMREYSKVREEAWQKSQSNRIITK